MSSRSPKAQIARLEYFFRDEVDGEDIGRRGDYDNLDPVDCAIRVMREFVALVNTDRKISRAELRAAGERVGHRAQLFRIDRRPEAMRLADAMLADLKGDGETRLNPKGKPDRWTVLSKPKRRKPKRKPRRRS